MSKTYIITSATPGCSPNNQFLKALESYSTINKAKLLILPTQSIYKKDLIDEAFDEKILEGDFKLNENLFISSLPINPEQVDPITGLDRLTNKESSVIYASPKQRMKSVASPSNDYPRVLMTPGSCTRPYSRFTRRSLVAGKDLVAGAIIVEIENESSYHFRQVQADSRGCFIDLGTKYSPDAKPSKVKTAAIVTGDWHAGYTDPLVKKATIEMAKYLKPDYLFMHDLFDGISVNHHINHKYLTKAMLNGQNSLDAELSMCADELKELSLLAKKNIVVVKSNHDEFLDRWLDEGYYLKDTTNHIIGLELALAKAKGSDPLEYGIRKYNDVKNAIFLGSDDSFRITAKSIECGQHGHLGPNGSRGSAASIEKAYGQSVTGHAHSPEILRGATVVGTSSYLKLNYNKGPSSWMQGHCVIYESGQRQSIHIFKGKWRL